MDLVRLEFRLIVDVRHNTVAADRVEIVQLSPGGDLYRRCRGGRLEPLAEGDLHSGDWFVITRAHRHLADAKQEAAAELERRGQQLMLLAERCSEFQEGTTNG